jgi:hypothetical protein
MNTEGKMNCVVENNFGDRYKTTFGENTSGKDLLTEAVKTGHEEFVAPCFNNEEGFENFKAGKSSLDMSLTSFCMVIDGESSISLDFDEPIVPQVRDELKAMDDDDIVRFVICAKMVVGAEY